MSSGLISFSTISVMASVTVLCTSVITSLISLFAFEVHEQIVQKPVNKYMNSILFIIDTGLWLSSTNIIL